MGSSLAYISHSQSGNPLPPTTGKSIGEGNVTSIHQNDSRVQKTTSILPREIAQQVTHILEQLATIKSEIGAMQTSVAKTINDLISNHEHGSLVQFAYELIASKESPDTAIPITADTISNPHFKATLGKVSEIGIDAKGKTLEVGAPKRNMYSEQIFTENLRAANDANFKISTKIEADSVLNPEKMSFLSHIKDSGIVPKYISIPRNLLEKMASGVMKVPAVVVSFLSWAKQKDIKIDRVGGLNDTIESEGDNKTASKQESQELSISDVLLKSVKAEKENILNPDGTVYAYELLVRFHGKDGEVIARTDKGLEALERSEKTFEVLESMTQEAVKIIEEEGRMVTVNVYLANLEDPRFIELIDKLGERLGLKRSHLVFEVLEKDYGTIDGAVQGVEYLISKGFHYSIDDLHIGSISEKILEEFVFDRELIPFHIKIDGDHIMQLLEEGGSHMDDETKRKIDSLLTRVVNMDISPVLIAEWIQNYSHYMKVMNFLRKYKLFVKAQGMKINSTNFKKQ